MAIKTGHCLHHVGILAGSLFKCKRAPKHKHSTLCTQFLIPRERFTVESRNLETRHRHGQPPYNDILTSH